MSFVRSFALRILGAVLVPAVTELYFFSAAFTLRNRHRVSLDDAVALAELVYVALSVALAAWLARPVGHALAPGALPEQRARAARAALRLPFRVAASITAGALALVAAVVALELVQGMPADLMAAAGASAAAFLVMQAGLVYSIAGTATAPALIALRSGDDVGRGSIRRKLVVLGLGLVAMTALLVGSVAYGRYRADTDRQYVDDVSALQVQAARWLEGRGPTAAAELVWAAASAPTAVLDATGKVLGRAGPPAAAVEGASAAGPAAEPVDGGWRLRRRAGAATLVTFLSERPLASRRAAFFGDAIWLGAMLVAAAALLVWAAARNLTGPVVLLGHAVDGIAGGDLTVSPPSVSRDEVGELAADFRRMTQGLNTLVRDVQAASEGVQDGTREMGQIGDRVQGGAREEKERVQAVEKAVEAMQGSVALVATGVEGLSEYVHSTSAAVGEMAAALEEVHRHASELERRVEAAAGDAERLSGAGRKAEAQLGALDQLASRAQTTLSSVSGSLAGVESSAVGSQLAAAQAAEIAERAGNVVGETVAAMEALREAVEDAKKRVTALGRRSDDIDQILDFIGEVAGRTNLLSLNASIIATQAGEHGKAFGVVAEQIRELAAQISASTKSIARILGAVRDDVAGTARLIERGDELATGGVAQARRSLEALGDIRTATARGHESAAAILDAVKQHAESTHDVSRLVEQAADASHALAEAIQMVGRSVAAAEGVSKGVRTVAEQVARALDEQSGLGRRQMESLERIDGMLADISRAVSTHQSATRRVRDVLAQLTLTARQQETVVVELAAVAERMGGRSRALAQSVGRFKI